jgi:HD-GYP domain-containing protein (c-di-GMP phosphodiesterase class II)
MRVPASVIAAASAATAAALLFRREHERRASAERFAATGLEALLNAIDANDPVTGAHVRRAASYALILADAAGVDQHQRSVVQLVALFHDIGKIHEALFDIIHDHDRLSPAERRAILTHPARGARVLAPLKSFYPELPEGVLSHHERWDGTGYPRQLKGRRIPLSARIVAIADTFDAITHRRRYRNGRSPRLARDVILEGRGTQFDPELVDLFVLPPVFERILATERTMMKWKTPLQPRPPGRAEDRVPDIAFRWRPERRRGRELPAKDRQTRTAR